MSASRATTLRDLAPKELFTVPRVRPARATRRSSLRTGAGASWLDSSNDYATATILVSTRPKNRSATSVAIGRWRTTRRNADGYSRRCSIASGRTVRRSCSQAARSPPTLLPRVDELARRPKRSTVSRAGATGLEPTLYPRDPVNAETSSSQPSITLNPSSQMRGSGRSTPTMCISSSGEAELPAARNRS
jgi:hypothetical protein